MPSTNSLQARSELVVQAPASDAYVSLQLATDIPLWWPLVRGVRRLPDAYELSCRAPFVGDLTLIVKGHRMDAAAGIIEVELSGDLQGVLTWTLYGIDGGSTRLVGEIDVSTDEKRLRRFAKVRPLGRWWLERKLRQGELGLRAYLAGLRRGRERCYI